MLGNLWRKLSDSFSIGRHPLWRASDRRFCPAVEPLEERTVLSIALFGVPTWVAQAVGRSRLELLKKFVA
jgi:hypothetical protein